MLDLKITETTSGTLAAAGDLSKSYYLKKADTSLIRSTLPKLYSFGYGKTLFGLVCYHENMPFGDKSYPLTVRSLKR